jgi:hypothetical protein
LVKERSAYSPAKLLLPGRTCGGCTQCCRALSVDAPNLVKPNGVTCPHVCSSGCSVYAARPAVCRDWYCAWRLTDTLDDGWRPDRSGILVEILFEEAVEGFAGPPLRFTLLRDTEDLFWPPFVDLVTKAVAIRQPVYLCLAGPSGMLPAKTFLNVPAFVAAVEADDAEAVRRCLHRAGQCLEGHLWERRSA